MYAHTGTQHNFPRDVRCFRHLYHLTKYQQVYYIRGDIAASQHFADHQLT
ncbi:Uncharacterised protein [Klebsiella pneumoniae]|nr:Uncharacterised protein [Klebsiella pneumoniae]